MAMADCSNRTKYEDTTIRRAVRILENRLRAPGAAMHNSAAVRDYLALLLAGCEREVFLVLFLDAQYRVISADEMFFGTLTQTSVYPREVARRALALNAASVIFAHNHPSGCAEPSLADRAMTQSLVDILAVFEVQTLDHFVIAGTNSVSMRDLGWTGGEELPAPGLGKGKRPRSRRRK